jgi:pilus assembly protein CpaB
VLVLVASKELSSGQFIKVKDLRWQAWPKTGVSDSYYIKGKPGKKTEDSERRNKKKAKSGNKEKRKKPGKGVIDDFVGAVVRSNVMPGEPITDGRIVRPGDRGFLAAVLKPGTRAISVPINATTGISGFVFPGDKVDMLLTHSIKGGSSDAVRRATETVLSDIRVLAVDQRTDDVEGKAVLAKTATLEVTPKQAEVIAVASEMGRLSLSLRSLAKEEPNAMTVRTARTFTWDTEASYLIPRRSNEKAAHVVKVVRGGSATAQKFAKNPAGGYSAPGSTNIQPAAQATANGSVAAQKNLIGKVQ